MGAPIAAYYASAIIAAAIVIVPNARGYNASDGYKPENENYYRCHIFMWCLPYQMPLIRFACIREK